MTTLSTVEDAIAYIEGKPTEGIAALQFNGELKTLSIEIKGPGYEGEITGEIARGLALFQEELYRAARFAHTGAEGRESRLTNAEKEALELRIEVRRGSTLINIDLGEWGKALASVLQNMPPADLTTLVVASVAILATAWVGRQFVSEHFKAKSARDAAQLNNEAQKAALDANVAIVEKMAGIVAADPRLERIAEASTVGISEIATRANNATSIKAGRLELDEADIATLKRRKPRSSAESIQETGKFRVLHVDGKTSPFKFTLAGAVMPGEFTIEFDESEFADEKNARIWAAIRSQTELTLQVKAVLLGGKIKGAVLTDIEPESGE